MAIRTTEEAVLALIDTEETLTPFIETASLLVDDNCTDSDYSDAKLELIERWLAAHFCAIKDTRAASEKAGSVGQSFQHKVDLNLAVTMYGQQAMLIDNAGNLAALNKQATDGVPKRAGITWLGRTEEHTHSDNLEADS